MVYLQITLKIADANRAALGYALSRWGSPL